MTITISTRIGRCLPFSVWRGGFLGMLLVLATAGGLESASGQNLDLRGGKGVDGIDFAEEMKDLFAPEDDLDGLAHSHFSEVYRWQGVAPFRSAEGTENAEFAWKAGRPETDPPRVLVAPVGDGAAWTVVNVPETGDYRLWLGYRAQPGQRRKVTLSLEESNRKRHEFGNVVLRSGETGEALEENLPIRFEDELHRIQRHSGPVMIWEYVDWTLNAGPTRLSLRSRDPEVRVDSVFLSASRASFVPSKSVMEGEGALYRTWCRVRVVEADSAAEYSIPGVGLGYHWRRIPRGSSNPLWYSRLGSADEKGFVGVDGAASIPVGEWTRWVEVTEDVMEGRWARGGGPWATASVGFRGVQRGQGEVQLAWHPHEAAVLKTARPGIAEGRAVVMIPLERLSLGPVADPESEEEGAWGMRRPDILARFETAGEVHERHFEWGREALAELGPAADNPTPRWLQIYTGCSAAPAARETAIRMLAALGINDMGPVPRSLREELDLPDPVVRVSAADSEYLCRTHDPLDPAAERNFEASLRERAAAILKDREEAPPLVRIKMGDEIGSEGGGSTVNGFETCKKAFHDYLRDRLAARNTRSEVEYGVERIEDLPFLDRVSDRAGRHERRLYYDSQRFKFVMTAMYYAQLTRAAERVFPRVQTYCNFSPHPPMFGQHMNGSDWFSLTRRGGANMAWGEDWAGGGGSKGSWGFTGFEVVSYYAAWVECAARTGGGLPAGFYVVSNMGGADRKMFSLVGRGIFSMHAYSWGPRYAGAEGSNFWSENRKVYAQIARGTHALGPADEILVRGRREPRRAAVLYNRTHEIWNGASGGFQTERLLEFAALSHAHVPTEIILEEDCSDETLAGYRVIYMQGCDIEQDALEALRRWVESGGILVGAAGAALRDESHTETGAAETLFGARQRLAGQSRGGWHPQRLPDHEPIDTLSLEETDLTPAMTLDVIGVKAELFPTTGQPVGTFANGACGAVVNALGRGKTLLLGVQPGMLYKGTAEGGSRYMLERRPLITKPAEYVLGRQRVEYSEPQTEVWLFEHENRAAVTLNNFAYFLEPEARPTVLSVQTDLEIDTVVSTLQGPLAWTREGDRIRVEMTAPQTVDVVILEGK